MPEPVPDPTRARELNHARWEGLAAAHGDDAYYNSDALVAGADSRRVRREADGRWRLLVSGQLLPMLFALRATRP
jgi:hypothetical protein